MNNHTEKINNTTTTSNNNNNNIGNNNNKQQQEENNKWKCGKCGSLMKSVRMNEKESILICLNENCNFPFDESDIDYYID
ncbi:hypothetical protein ABK040_015258 [Willaertia magna]